MNGFFTQWHTTHDKTVFKTLTQLAITDKAHHTWFKPHLLRARQLVDQFEERPPDLIDKWRIHMWFKNGDIKSHILHRDGDLPAVIEADGTRIWYRNGMRHRDNDLPAYIGESNSREWYRYGMLHRDGDQPAIMWASGTREWYRNGQRYFPSQRN